MTVIPIASADDPRIALFRHVREPELVRSHGMFVAEGRLVVERVLADPRFEVVSLLVNDAAHAALAPALERSPEDVVTLRCDSSLLEAITGFDVHRGCLALVRRPTPIGWRDAVRSTSLIVVLEDVANADNVGGVFRNAAAFDAGAVLLSPGCCDPLYRKAIRTSMAMTLRVPYARLEPWPDMLDDLRAEGFMLAALSLREPSVSLRSFTSSPRAERVALLVGAEGSGLSDAVERRADARVRIPISDGVDSLNLAVATGIALSHLARV